MRTSGKMENGKILLYEEIAAKICGMIDDGTYRVGERVPSIRDLSQKMRVSANTVMEAYANLENFGRIEARPQSGYYVRSSIPELRERPGKEIEATEVTPHPVIQNDVTLRVMRNITDASLVPLGGAIPNYDLLPADKLNRILASEVRRFPVQSVSYSASKGTKRLRTQIAKRSLGSGCSLSADDIVITSGCVEAISMSLQAICRPGDTVAIGSPVYYTFLNFIQWMGLKVLEIPSTPKEGMSLDVLSYAIRHNPVHACIAISNFNNPLGSLMPDEKKRELVKLLAKHEIPLIEDDVYGDLAFGALRPTALKTYDEKGMVLYCSSYSKTLAPGYRIGWIAPGKFRSKIIQLKSLFNIATATPTQLAVAEFLTNGGYDHHLRRICRVYSRQVNQVRDAVGRHFPLGTRVSRPEGGFVVWVELPEEIDTLKLYEAALKEGISIAPGQIFTLGDKYGNCLRLNAAIWSEQVEQALETLGGLAGNLV
ncbi:MAG: PLP-dependent aminotransferase family protein [Desulfuromonadaceae bacterium]|nr:PLP-dependent aminotransferase family protein [Desulfuromonadaceae bacterium]